MAKSTVKRLAVVFLGVSFSWLLFLNFTNLEAPSLSSLSNVTPELCSQSEKCRIFYLNESNAGIYSEIDTVLAAAAVWSEMSSNHISYVIFKPNQTFHFPRRQAVWSSLHIKNLSRLVLDGNGSRFTVHPSNTFLSVINCRVCVFKNFTVAPTSGIYSQGQVVSLSSDHITVKVETGFPLLTFPMSNVVDSSTIGVGKPEFVGVMFQKSGRLWTFPEDPLLGRGTRPHFLIKGVHVIDSQERIIRIQLPAGENPTAYYEGILSSGSQLRFAFMLPNLDPEKRTLTKNKDKSEVGDSTGYIYLAENRNLALQDIRINFSPTRAVLADGNSRALRLNRIRISPEFPTQLLSVMNGAIIMHDNESASIGNITIHGSLDDMFNFTISPLYLDSISQDQTGTSYTLQKIGRSYSRVSVGDQFNFFDPVQITSSPIPLIVTSVTSDPEGKFVVKFDQPISNSLSAANTLTLDKLRFKTRFYNLSQGHKNLKISGADLERGARNAVLCSGCTVEDSRITNIALRALGATNREVADGSQPGGALPDIDDTVFARNQVSYIRGVAVWIQVLSSRQFPGILKLDPVVKIFGNTFDTVGEGIYKESGFQRYRTCDGCQFSY